MLAFTFFLNCGLNQIMFLFRCFLLVAVFIFAWYLIDNGTCLMIDGEWLDSVFMYFIFFDYFLFGTDDKLNGVTSK